VEKAILVSHRVFSLKRSTARVFAVPSRVMSQKKKDMTGDILKTTLEIIRCNRLYGNIKNYESVS